MVTALASSCFRLWKVWPVLGEHNNVTLGWGRAKGDRSLTQIYHIFFSKYSLPLPPDSLTLLVNYLCKMFFFCPSLKSGIFNWDRFCSPGNAWQYLETVLIVTTVGGQVLLAFSEQKPRMMPHILQGRGSPPQQRIIYSSTSVVQRLRNPAFHSVYFQILYSSSHSHTPFGSSHLLPLKKVLHSAPVSPSPARFLF